jgi:glycosyltransferase involved in cell wall biosynthesis
MRVCIVIPVYNHEHAVKITVAEVRKHGVSVILVDDGSGETCAAELRKITAADSGLELLRLPINQGKGGAVMAGLLRASQLGFTHALQIDADGQHDAGLVPTFVSTALSHPTSMICGEPRFDFSIPRHRFYLRYLTHLMVWLNTLSLDIKDSMCGFRVYPLSIVLPVIESERPGRRMDFDIEILVRLHWRGVPMQWIPSRVSYPADGVSHFRLIRDNALLTILQIRLLFGMLRRLPRLLGRRLQTVFAPAGESR